VFGTHDLGLFVVTALVLNATPGVDLLYTVTRTLQFGWRGGVAAALGIAAGCSVHALAAALGLAALLAASPRAFDAIRWAGAAYLLWLAWGMLRAAVAPPAEPPAGGAAATTTAASARRVFLQGLTTNLLNPKVALFFMALLPQFVRADAAAKPLAFLFLGAIFIINGTLFLLMIMAVVLRARRFGARRFDAQPGLRRALHALGATLFAALAGRLALAAR
jgi:threonine/homoserine/homoserine lactone efflux protein